MQPTSTSLDTARRRARGGVLALAGLWVLGALAGCAERPGTQEGVDGGGPADAGGGGPGGVTEPGWSAPFALDPSDAGFERSATWDFSSTSASGPGPILGSGTFENAADPSAPVSAPGVGRALFATGQGSQEGATWTLTAPDSNEVRRLYFRAMVALSDPYAASRTRQTFLQLVQRQVGGGTVGQSTLDLLAQPAPVSDGEALGAPLRFSVGVRTPTGPSYPQSAGPDFTRGAWHQVEGFFMTSSASRADGVARVWLDGVLVFEKTDVAWAPVDAYWSEVAWADRADYQGQALPDGGQFVAHDHLQVFWSKTRE